MRRPGPPEADRKRKVALATAAGCALGLVVVRIAAVDIGAGHERDSAMLHGFTGLAGERVYEQIRHIALLADPVPYALLGLACIGIALVRRRPERAVATAVALVGTGATTHVLKHLLAKPRVADWLLGGQIEAVSWPSGHGTAAMTLALCAVMVASPGLRAAVALAGAAGTITLGYATLALTWHYPSDLFAGFLVAGLWVSLALAVLSRVEAADAEGARPPSLAWVVAPGAAGALVAAALVGIASERVSLDATDRATVVVGALALAALAVALVAATVVAASEPAPDGSARPLGTARRRTPARA